MAPSPSGLGIYHPGRHQFLGMPRPWKCPPENKGQPCSPLHTCILVRDCSLMSDRSELEMTLASQDVGYQLNYWRQAPRPHWGLIDVRENVRVMQAIAAGHPRRPPIPPVVGVGASNLAAGLMWGAHWIEEHRRTEPPGPRGVSLIVLFSDGRATTGGDPNVEADRIKSLGFTIAVVASGDTVDESVLRRMASSADHFCRRAVHPERLRRWLQVLPTHNSIEPSASAGLIADRDPVPGIVTAYEGTCL